MAFTKCRERVGMVSLHFCHFRTRFQQVFVYDKLLLLYLLDKSECLSVLRSLNQFSDQRRDFRNGFESGHNQALIPKSRAENNEKQPGSVTSQ